MSNHEELVERLEDISSSLLGADAYEDLFHACSEAAAAIRELVAERARMPEWISTADQMPESGQIVLAFHLSQLDKPRRIRAAYIKKMTQEASPESDLDCDYDEATDTFYWPEGWYEQMEHWEEYTAVILAEDIQVTHWMPLPDPPGDLLAWHEQQ